jgi:hypothetical protein
VVAALVRDLRPEDGNDVEGGRCTVEMLLGGGSGRPVPCTRATPQAPPGWKNQKRGLRAKKAHFQLPYNVPSLENHSLSSTACAGSWAFHTTAIRCKARVPFCINP